MENDVFKAIVVSAESGILFLILHSFLWKLLSPTKKGIFLIMGVGLVSSGVVMIGNWMYLNINPQSYILGSGPLSMLLLMCYLHLYVAIERSISIRILGELSQVERNRLTKENLLKKFPYQYMIQHRVNLMVEKKWLIEDAGKYICSSRGEKLSQAAIFLKKCYGIRVTG